MIGCMGEAYGRGLTWNAPTANCNSRIWSTSYRVPCSDESGGDPAALFPGVKVAVATSLASDAAAPVETAEYVAVSCAEKRDA